LHPREAAGRLRQGHEHHRPWLRRD
jgi:hypothetical protein